MKINNIDKINCLSKFNISPVIGLRFGSGQITFAAIHNCHMFLRNEHDMFSNPSKANTFAAIPFSQIVDQRPETLPVAIGGASRAPLNDYLITNYHYMRLLFFFMLVLTMANLSAQNIAINGTGALPDGSAMLDITSTSKGMLIPRMTTAQRTAIVSPATGLLVYDTSLQTFYYFDGTAWRSLLNGSSGWQITGNAGTSATTNFVGTTDNVTLKFRVNNIHAGKLSVGNDVFLGYDAGTSNINVYATGVGSYAMHNNTSGASNTAIGYSASYSNYSGAQNTAAGFNALYANTASYNSAFGAYALTANTSGTNNVSVGRNSMLGNISGSQNTVVGVSALESSVSYGYNTVMGYQAMMSAGAGYCVAIGVDALKSNTSNNLVAVGYSGLSANTTGNYNTAIGYNAIKTNTIGSSNTGVGYEALKNSTTSSNNTAVGTSALLNNTSGLSNTAVGKSALSGTNTGSYNTAMGVNSLQANTTGSNNTSFGYNALASYIGDNNTAFGYYALNTCNSGTYNTAVGTNALKLNSAGASGTAVGYNALQNSTVSNNTAVGYNAGQAITTGVGNTLVGGNSLSTGTTSAYNTGLGYNALKSYTASYAVAIGAGSMELATIATGSVAVGYQSLANVTGIYNTAVGYNAGNICTSNSNLTLIGYGADASTATGITNSTAVGNGAVVNATANVRLGNTTITSIGGYANWTNISDGRFKNNIQENVPGLDFILALRPVTYHLDIHALSKYTHTPVSQDDEVLMIEKEKTLYSGFIAQEVEALATALGYDFSGVDKPESETDPYGLRYAEFVVPMVKAIQEQQIEIEALKSIIAQQQEMIDNIISVSKGN